MLTVNESILTNCCYFLPFAFQLWSPARPTSLTLSQKAREQTFGSHSPKQHSTQKALVVSHFEEQDWITVSCHLSTLGHSLFSGESESESSHPASRVRAPPPLSAGHAALRHLSWTVSTSSDSTTLSVLIPEHSSVQTCLKCFNRVQLFLKLSFHSQNKTTKKDPMLKSLNKLTNLKN